MTPTDAAAGSVVMVVDDDAPLVKALARLLKGRGYTTLAAHSAKEALDLAASSPVLDLVLTDYRMPGETGVELVRELRGRGCAAPAILITANFDAPEVQEAMTEGLFVGTLSKPWDLDELLAKVAAAIRPRA